MKSQNANFSLGNNFCANIGAHVTHFGVGNVPLTPPSRSYPSSIPKKSLPASRDGIFRTRFGFFSPFPVTLPGELIKFSIPDLGLFFVRCLSEKANRS